MQKVEQRSRTHNLRTESPALLPLSHRGFLTNARLRAYLSFIFHQIGPLAKVGQAQGSECRTEAGPESRELPQPWARSCLGRGLSPGLSQEVAGLAGVLHPRFQTLEALTPARGLRAPAGPPAPSASPTITPPRATFINSCW